MLVFQSAIALSQWLHSHLLRPVWVIKSRKPSPLPTSHMGLGGLKLCCEERRIGASKDSGLKIEGAKPRMPSHMLCLEDFLPGPAGCNTNLFLLPSGSPALSNPNRQDSDDQPACAAWSARILNLHAMIRAI